MKKLRKVAILQISLCLILPAIALALGPAPDASATPGAPEYLHGEVVVRIRSSAVQAQSLQSGAPVGVLANFNGSARKLFSLPGDASSSNGGVQALAHSSLDDVYVLSVTDTAAAIDELSKSSDVIWAEPNYILKTFAADPLLNTSGAWDQRYDDMWGLKKVNAPGAWQYTRGKGIVVAVVDSGVDWQHPDIAANIWHNAGEIPDNGIDDDGNGFIDDIRGWDFTTCDKYFLGFCIEAKSPDNNPMDENGHGTHVAGTIAAIRNNGIGIAGVAPEATIMAIRGIGANGAASIDQLAVAVRYAIDNGADVINNSWGGAGESKLLHDVFAYGEQRGVVSIAAAGNSDEDVRSIIPAKLNSVITVASTDENDRKSSFSNYSSTTRYGPKAVSGIDIAAPGGGNKINNDSGFATHVNILSLRAQNTDMYSAAEGYTPGAFFVSDGTAAGKDRYYRASGTSMAAPHVAGIAALALAKYYADNPNKNKKNQNHRREAMHEVRARIELSGKILPATQKNGAGDTVHIGERRANALGALIATRRPHLHVMNDSVVEVSGNGDGIPEAHELVAVRFTLVNKWAPASAVRMELIPQTTNVVMHTASADLGSIRTRELKTQAAAFSFSAAVGQGLQPVDFILRTHSTLGNKTITQDLPVTVFLGAKKLSSTVARTARSFLNLLLPSPIYRPAIDGARVVWTDTRSGSYNVHYYNGATAEEMQITNHGGNQGSPDISGDHIVYEDGKSGKTKIIHYTISNGQLRQLPVPTGYAQHNHLQPRISGDSVVWTASKDYPAFSSDANVIGFSFKTGTASLLSRSKKAQINPDVANETVVFEDEDIKGVRLLPSLFNPFSTTSVGPLFSLPLHPRTDGNYIIYTAFSIFNGLNVYVSPIENATFLPYGLVTNSFTIKSAPDISGEHAVWQEQINGNWDIYFKNLHTGLQQRITHSEHPDEQPVVSSYYIAWVNDTVLWLAAAPGASPPPPEKPHFNTGLNTFTARIRQNKRTGVVRVVLRNLPETGQAGSCSVSFFTGNTYTPESYLGRLSDSHIRKKFSLRRMPGIRSFRTKRARLRAKRNGNDAVKISAIQVCNGKPVGISSAKLVRSKFDNKQILPPRWLKKFSKKLSRAN